MIEIFVKVYESILFKLIFLGDGLELIDMWYKVWEFDVEIYVFFLGK